MDRNEIGKKIISQLFEGLVFTDNQNDPEYYNIMNCFLYGEVWQQGHLDVKMREMITLAVMAANQTMEQCKVHIIAAMNAGVTPVEIKETFYHCSPYIGFPKTQNCIAQANEVFEERGISLPLNSQATTTEDTRYEKGLNLQKSIFGERIEKSRVNAPENQKHFQDYLSAYCFGDIYTRSGLYVKTRELLTFSILCALGGCENQLRGHIQGNVNVGNSKETLITVVTQCMPYIGFPRTLNALDIINEILPESN